MFTENCVGKRQEEKCRKITTKLGKRRVKKSKEEKKKRKPKVRFTEEYNCDLMSHPSSVTRPMTNLSSKVKFISLPLQTSS